MKKNNYLDNAFSKVYSLFLKCSFLNKFKELIYYLDRLMIITIKKPKYKPDKKKKIIIVFNLALGDVIVFICSLINIRKFYPKNKYHITILCQTGLEKMFKPIGIFDEIVGVNFTKSTINLKERYKTIKILRQNYYDLLLDPVGANECFTNVLTSRNICAKKKVGCIINSKEELCSKYILKKTYNELKRIEDKTLIGQYFEYFYENNESSFYEWKTQKLKFDLPKEFYIVFPSASNELKRYPIERYAEIVKRVYEKTKLPLLLCGTNIDKNYYEELLKLIPDVPYCDIIGKTSLLEFIEVIKQAKFVITNDTSTYHIAITNQVPVAIITGGYTYDRYVSYDFKGNENYKKPYIIVSKQDCFNCYNRCAKLKKGENIWPCLNDIDVEYAWQIINDMIEKEV